MQEKENEKRVKKSKK